MSGVGGMLPSVPTSLSGLLVALVALLPGGVHTWMYERVTGKSLSQAGDRLSRLLAASAVYLVLSAFAFPVLASVARAASSGGGTSWWRYFVVVGLLVVLPALVGGGAGLLTNRRHQRGWRGRLGRLIAGVGHASRAWDHLFGVQGLRGSVRVVLTDGTHLIGYWGERGDAGLGGSPPSRSYASGYPGQQRDLYISQLIRIDQADGSSQTTAGALWVPADSIRYLEFHPSTTGESPDA